jgi:predicted ArsR family transcriptional regulator
MDLEALLAPDAGSGLGRSRARVLELLRETDSPLGVQDIADRTGLHPNTARFHLDGLVEAGLATREAQARGAAGRPSMAYRAAGPGPAGPRRYRLLAEMLTSLIAGLMAEPGEAAAAAGREWGAYLTEPPPPYQRIGASESLARLTAILAELGFAPQLTAEGEPQLAAEGEPQVAALGDRYRLSLRECPFKEVALQHQDVVCALHLGLMRGVLAQLRSAVTADRLEPFAEPGLCVGHLSAGEKPPLTPTAAGRR